MKGKGTGRLEDWFTEYETPTTYSLMGNVYDDKKRRWPDGRFIHTSFVLKANHPIEELKEGAVIQTRNNKYLLGKREEEEEGKGAYAYRGYSFGDISA